MNFPAPTIFVISACNNPVGRPQKIRLSADAVKKEVKFVEKRLPQWTDKGGGQIQKILKTDKRQFFLEGHVGDK